MSYYSDYTVNIPYNTSVLITKSAVANAAADLLVAHAGFDLVGYANTEIGSSATNYAEVEWHDLHIRIYNTSTTNYALDFNSWYEEGTSSVIGISKSIPSVTGISATVSMRFYNTKKGFKIDILNPSSSWVCVAYGLILDRIKDGVTYYGLANDDIGGNTLLVNDGLSITYHIPSTNISGGTIDEDGIKQVLSICGISVTTGSNIKRFLAQDVYTATSFILSGFVSVGGRYFHIRGVLAFEINA
jgi:hypothetical protein